MPESNINQVKDSEQIKESEQILDELRQLRAVVDTLSMYYQSHLKKLLGSSQLKR